MFTLFSDQNQSISCCECGVLSSHSLHLHQLIPVSSLYGLLPSTSISTVFLFLSLLDSPQKLRCPILHSLSTPNFLPFYFLLSLSASSLPSPHLPACSNLTNLLFSPISVLSSHYLLIVPFPLASYSRDPGQLSSFLMSSSCPICIAIFFGIKRKRTISNRDTPHCL